MLEDTIFWRMEEFGCRGTASELWGDTFVVKAYIHQDQAHPLDLAALALSLRQDALCLQLPEPITQWDVIEEEDWADGWKQYWHPQEVGDRLLIYPAWLPLPPVCDRKILRLDPGVAFGTGTHPTTQLCLEALEMRLGLGSSQAVVADIGCGSGILSIGACLLGAPQVFAVDTDPLAVQSTASNRELNQLDPQRLVVALGSVAQLQQLTPEPVDGIVCNILADVIIEVMPQLAAIAKPTTWGILSGLLLDQAKAVADAVEHEGWVVAALWKRKDWCCMNIRRT